MSADDLYKLLAARREIDEALLGNHSREVAVLFTDMVDSTRIFEERGDIEGLALVRRHNELLFPVVEAHHGRVVKTIGDAIMAVFEDPADAVRCAAAMQRALAANRPRSGTDEVHVRIGVHAGRAMLDGDDVFGDTVNTAARVQSKAGPDEVLISAGLYERVAGVIDLPVEPAGTLTLKGKAEPVPVVRLLWHPGPKAAAAPSPAVSVSPRPSPRRRWALSAAVAGLLIAGAAGSLLSRGPSPAPVGSPPALADQAAAIPAGSSEPIDRGYAIIVGVNSSMDEGVASLRYADDDAVKYAQLFGRMRHEVQLLTVLDEESRLAHPELAGQAKVPERRSLERAIAEVRGRIARDHGEGRSAALYFVYVGHGAREKDGEGYVSLVDDKLTRSELHDLLLRVPENPDERPDFVHLIIDACSAYFVVNARGDELKVEEQGYQQYAKMLFGEPAPERSPHVGMLLATSGDVTVHEWSAYRGGVFSHLVRSGLSGAADVDIDGRVTYGELGAFIAAAGQALREPKARLEVPVRPPPPAVLAPLAERRRFQPRELLILDPAIDGHFQIESDRGERLIDLHKPKGLPAIFALWGSGRYYLSGAQGEALLDFSKKDFLAASALSFAQPRQMARGPIDEAYRQDLFTEPFNGSFYRGWCSTRSLPVSKGLAPGDVPEDLKELLPSLPAGVAAFFDSQPAGDIAASHAAPRGEAAPPANTGPVRVSVLDFQHVGGEEANYSRAFQDTVTTELALVQDIVLTERVALHLSVGELELTHRGGFDPEKLAPLGKLHGSEVAVLGGWQQAGGQMRVTARFVEVKTGIILHGIKVQRAARQVMDLQDDLAEEVRLAIPILKAKMRPAAESP